MQTISQVAFFLLILWYFLTRDLHIVRKKFDSNFWYHPVAAICNTEILKATNKVFVYP